MNARKKVNEKENAQSDLIDLEKLNACEKRCVLYPDQIRSMVLSFRNVKRWSVWMLFR